MPVRFRKQFISEERYESAAVFDVNGDGVPDIVSGAFWYEGPDFTKRHFIGEVMPFQEYYDDFSTIALDINGDGYTDFITGGWFGKTLQWRENPKGDPAKQWPLHTIAEVSNVETTRGWDIDGDGVIEIIPNTPGGPLRIFKLDRDGNGRGKGTFTPHMIREDKQGHGLGCGDIAGNGRMDIVLKDGWLEAPAQPYEEPWVWHADFDLGNPSIPILVVDVDGDGVNELVAGQAHDYGLHWWRQQRDGDRRTWTRHTIDPDNSQYHDLIWADIDGDGQCELITGKRYRAHCGRDPGTADPLGIYYFKWNGESFTKQVIDYGPAGQGNGCGIHFAVADLNGDGRLDVVAPGKDGLYVYWNLGAG